jgi:hypothetical protein
VVKHGCGRIGIAGLLTFWLTTYVWAEDGPPSAPRGLYNRAEVLASAWRAPSLSGGSQASPSADGSGQAPSGNQRGSHPSANEKEDSKPPALPITLSHISLPYNVKVSGWLEQGFTWNPDSPDDRFNGPNVFNFRSNEYLMNQLYLYFERPVDTEGQTWDLGGRVDVLYGTDYRFIAQRGLEREQDGTHKWNSDDGPGGAAMYGITLPQFYVDIFAPVGRGLTIRAGHMVTLLGAEVIAATGNFFYSHTYSFGYGIPFRHTGYYATYPLTDRLTIQSGFTLGADNFTDPNDNLGYLGSLTYKWSDRTTAIYAVSWQENNFDRQFENSAEYIHTILIQTQICEGIRYWFETTFGYGEDQALTATGTKHAEWYGINNYLFYDLTDTLAVGARFEWFRDEDNARILAVGDLAQGGNYFGFTLGLNWKAFSNFLLRPEVRWDWSNAAVIGEGGPYDDRSDKNQFTAAVDAIVTF